MRICTARGCVESIPRELYRLNPAWAGYLLCMLLLQSKFTHKRSVRCLHTTWNTITQKKTQVSTVSDSNERLKIYALLQQAIIFEFRFSNSSIKLIRMALPTLLFLQNCCSLMFSSTAEISHPISTQGHKEQRLKKTHSCIWPRKEA